MSLSKAKAAALWDKLRANFLDQELILKEIISERAWEPLGYQTFADAWNAKMSHVTLFAEFRPHVVYQLLAEGSSPEDVAASVRGIGPESAEFLDRQRKSGLAADEASTVVREHNRKLPSPDDTLHVKVGKTWLTEYRRIAKRLDLNVEQVAKQAIAARFKELVSETRNKGSE